MRADSRQDVTQVGERIDAAERTSGDQAVDDLRPAAAAVVADEQPVLATDRHLPIHGCGKKIDGYSQDSTFV